MNIRIFVAALLVSLSLSANADFKTLVEAYEVSLDRFQVPVTQNGIIQFSQCDDCEVISARLSTRTFFIVDGKYVDLQEFRKAAFSIRDKDAVAVIIATDVESNVIESIEI